MWPLAAIVFVASVFVPLLKLLILIYLLISVQVRSGWRPRERTRLYRITETIGRWSMVDGFVISILVALVRLGNLDSVEAQTEGHLLLCGRGPHHAGRHIIRFPADLGQRLRAGRPRSARSGESQRRRYPHRLRIGRRIGPPRRCPRP